MILISAWYLLEGVRCFNSAVPKINVKWFLKFVLRRSIVRGVKFRPSPCDDHSVTRSPPVRIRNQ